MRELDAHTVLVRARNGMARFGFDARNYGCYEEDCGTAKCALGWVGWESGIRGSMDLLLRPESAPPSYLAALEALEETLPEIPSYLAAVASKTLPRRVESVAISLKVTGRLEEVEPWFDRAIAATAPSPDFSSLELELVS